MKKTYYIISVLFICANAISFTAKANPPPLEYLLSAKTIRCTVADGYHNAFINGALKTEKSKFSSKPEDSVITYTNINLEQGTALVVGNGGSENISALPASFGLNFIEVTNTGAVILSTVFNNKDKHGNFFFSTSRHTHANWGDPESMPSQYIGSCTVLE